MKLLNWMHHKLQQIKTNPCKEVASGNFCTCLTVQSSLNDQQSSTRQSFGSRVLDQKLTVFEHEDKRVENGTTNISHISHSFLAIGTLGTKPIPQEHEKESFPIYFEEMKGEEADMRDDYNKRMNDHLNKGLETKVETAQCKKTSRKNNHVGSFTVSSEMVSTKADEKLKDCSLRVCQFGTALELPEARLQATKEKVSLGQLFERSKIEEQHSKMKCEKKVLQEKSTYKSTKHPMKKMLKNIWSLPKIPPGKDAATNVSTVRKLYQVPHRHHRRIHPESITAVNGDDEPQRPENMNSPCGYSNEDMKLLDEETTRNREIHATEGNIDDCKAIFDVPRDRLSSRETNANRECWIRTDPDYLVLEL